VKPRERASLAHFLMAFGLRLYVGFPRRGLPSNNGMALCDWSLQQPKLLNVIGPVSKQNF